MNLWHCAAVELESWRACIAGRFDCRDAVHSPVALRVSITALFSLFSLISFGCWRSAGVGSKDL
jgi:hypothetical protein